MKFKQWKPWHSIKEKWADQHPKTNELNIAKYGSLICLYLNRPANPEHIFEQDDEIQTLSQLLKDSMFQPSTYSNSAIAKKAETDKKLLENLQCYNLFLNMYLTIVCKQTA